jgi:hypothetical protein
MERIQRSFECSKEKNEEIEFELCGSAIVSRERIPSNVKVVLERKSEVLRQMKYECT